MSKEKVLDKLELALSELVKYQESISEYLRRTDLTDERRKEVEDSYSKTSEEIAEFATALKHQRLSL